MPILLIAMSAAILFALQAIIYRWFAQRGLSAQLSFEEEMVAEGETAVIIEQIVNRKALPLAAVRATFRLDRSLYFLDEENVTVTDYTYRNDVYSLAGYEAMTCRLPVRCSQRGQFQIQEMKLTTNDLFFTRAYFTDSPQQAGFLVCPGPVSQDKLEIPFRRMMGTLLTRRRTLEDPFELQGIRPYQSYDGMKDINWKASARSGEYQVNLHGYTSSQQVKILLNLEQNDLWGRRGLLEEGIRIAAAYARVLIEQGVPVCVVSNGRDSFSGAAADTRYGAGKQHLRAIQETLARVEYAVEDDHIVDLLRRERQSAEGRQTVYVLISTSQEERMLAEYSELCRHCEGAQWIAPLPYGTPQMTERCPRADTFRWEVAYE